MATKAKRTCADAPEYYEVSAPRDMAGVRADATALHFLRGPLSGSTLNRLATFKALRHLRIDHAEGSDAWLEDLARHRSLRQLETLELHGLDDLLGTTLTALGELGALTKLSLSACRSLLGKHLAALASLSTLRTLTIDGMKKSTPDASLELIARLPLREFSLRNTPKLTAGGVRHLGAMTSLRALDLSYCSNLDNACLTHIAELRNLESLSVRGGQKIYDDGLRALSALKNLRALDLGVIQMHEEFGTGITANGVQHLRALPRLEKLDLSNNAGIKAPAMTQLAGLPKLRELRMTHSRIATDDLEAVSEFVSLEVLDLSHADHVTDDVVRQVAKLRKLRELTCSTRQPGSIGDGALRELAKMKNLEKLHIHAADASNAGMAQLGRLTSLRSLAIGGVGGGIYGAQVSGRGYLELCALKKLNSLEVTFGSGSDTAGLRAICTSLPSLRRLSVRAHGNRFGDTELALVAKIATLCELSLDYCHVTDRGLAELTKLKSLRALSLNGCDAVTAVGFQPLAKMPSVRAVQAYLCKKVKQSEVDALLGSD